LILIVTAVSAFGQTEREAHTVALNGIELYYEVTGEGSPLICLHGFTRTGHAYDPFVTKFAQHYRCYLVDLRGHGGSTNPSGEWTMRQSTRDIIALLDHLQIERCKVIGISAGAVTTLHVATQQPDRIEAMVLIGSGTYFPVDCREVLGQYSSDTFPEASLARMRNEHQHGDEQILALIDQLGAFATSYDDVTFTPPTLATITARTLFVHGDRDYCFPVPMVADNYDAIPDAYLWIVPNGGHVPIYGRHTAYFTETVLEFLNGEWEAE